MRARQELSGRGAPRSSPREHAPAEPVRHHRQQVALGAPPRADQNERPREAADRVDRRPPAIGIDIPGQLADEAKIERPLSVAVAVSWRNPLRQRQRRQRTDRPRLSAQHRRPFLPPSGSAAEAASSHPRGAVFNRQGRSRNPVQTSLADSAGHHGERGGESRWCLPRRNSHCYDAASRPDRGRRGHGQE